MLDEIYAILRFFIHLYLQCIYGSVYKYVYRIVLFNYTDTL